MAIPILNEGKLDVRVEGSGGNNEIINRTISSVGAMVSEENLPTGNGGTEDNGNTEEMEVHTNDEKESGGDGIGVQHAEDSDFQKDLTKATGSGTRRNKRYRNGKLKPKKLSAMRLASTELKRTQGPEKALGRVLPWASWQEWLHMKDLLASNDYVAARALLSIFNLHRRSTVPVTVSSSVELVSLLNSHPESPVSSHNKRLALAMAITRFVNGITDFLQPRDLNLRTRTVATVAARLQIPPLLVEIRHHASHIQLPPLPALDAGARQALHWLDVFYWQVQYNHLREQSLLPNDKTGEMEHLRSIFAHKSFSKLHSSSRLPRVRKKSMKRFEPFGAAGKIVLDELVQCIRDWPPVVEQTIQAKSVVGRHESPYGIWSECENPDDWVQMPIGLMPGQTVVPTIPLDVLSDRKVDFHENYLAADCGDSCDSCDDIEIGDAVRNAQPLGIEVSRQQGKHRAELLAREKLAFANQVRALQARIDRECGWN